MNPSAATHQADDAALVAASRRGEIEAFGRLVERYQNLVCAIAFGHTGDRRLSEDVGQETFLTAWRKLDTIREPEKLRSWLCGIARHLAGKAARRARREQVADADSIAARAGADPGPLEAALSRETEETVWRALADLPPTYREPLVLFYREDQSVKEVAAGLGLSEAVARQRLSRGRKALKEGVSDLVERTLASSRPRRAFTAAVLAALASVAGSASAAGAASAAGGTGAAPAAAASRGFAGGSKLLAIGLGAAVTVAILAAVLLIRASGSGGSGAAGPAAPAPAGADDAQILAALHERREAAVAAAPAPGPCELGGRVIDDRGEPVVGALVAVIEESLQSSGTALDPEVLESDADGRWQSGPLNAGRYLITASAPGLLAEARFEQCGPDASAAIELPLAPAGATVRGVITDLGGGPVPAATVWLLPAAGHNHGAVTTRTGADGSYEIAAPPDRYNLLVIHPEYVLDARPVVVAGEPPAEDFVLWPGGTIEGTVVARRSGEPVPGASVHPAGVSLSSASDGPWAYAAVFGAIFPVTTDHAGRFRLTGLPPGPIEVVATAGRLASHEPATAELGIAETRDGVTIEVGEAFTVSGFVVKADSPRDGLAGVNVALHVPGALAPPRVATTGTGGYFKIAGVVPGDYWILAAGGEAAPLIVADAVEVTDADVRDMLVRAERGVAIAGRLEPPVRATVTLEPASPDWSHTGTLAMMKAAMARAEVDATGRFRFPAVEPGDYTLVARTVDSEGRVAATVPASGLTEQVVTLEPQPRIEGTVTDEAGTPLAGALVAAEPRRPSRPRPYLDALHTRGRTDARGCFRIPGLAPGTYQLLVFDAAGQRPWSGAAEDGFEPRDIDLSADLVTVDLIVASGARRVRGRVVDVAGDPVEDARVVVSATGALLPPSGHAGRPVLTDRRGRFEVAGVFGEELEIAATGPRGKRQAAPLNVTGDDPVELIVAPLSTLRAAVIDGDEPVEGFELRVGRGPSSVLGERVAQERGGFEIPRLIAGDYEIEIRAGDRYASEIVTVGPGPVTSVSFELQPMASVRGRLLDADGAPVSGAVVSAIGLTLALDRGGKAAGGSRPRTGADGSFAIRGLIAGRGYLTFTRSPRGFDLIGMAAIELAPGQDLDLGAVRGGGLMTPSIPSRDHSPDLGLRFWLGSGPPTPAELARADGAPPRPPAPPGSRLWIAAVKEDSPAHRAGFQAGDRVVAVGQRRIGDGAAALEAMASLTQRWRSRGRSVEWVIQRHGQERRVPVLVPER